MNELKKEYVYIIIVGILAFAYLGGEWLKINHKDRIRKENIEYKEKQRQACEECIKQAEEDYYNVWNHTCKSRGLKEDCSLPLNVANSIEKDLQNNKKICIEKFKNNAFEVEE